MAHAHAYDLSPRERVAVYSREPGRELISCARPGGGDRSSGRKKEDEREDLKCK